MATAPTVHIVCSDQHRNGKTLLARLLVDFLMLDGRDPFCVDTDAPDGPLRTFFPGRTALADFAAITGQMKLFDTILASPGRDYVIDLASRHLDRFFQTAADLDFFAECHKAGFRIFVFFIVDNSFSSLKAAYALQRTAGVDLFVPVRNMLVRSHWPENEGALTLPFLAAPVASAIANRRFSLRSFVNGDPQGLAPDMEQELRAFLYEVLNGLNGLEPLRALPTK
ncbi:MAG: hypothetical protein U1E15_06850 [Hyphomicrobiales bacterium]